MTGCEACSALVAAGDVSCATCGADLGQPATRKPARAAAGKVVIPVRRYGNAPPSPRSPRSPRSLRRATAAHAGRGRLALLAVLLSAGFAGALAALLQFW